MSISLLFILIIALIAAAIPYVCRAFVWNRLNKYMKQNNTEKALQLLEGRLFSFLFGEMSQTWNEVKIYLQLQDGPNIEKKTRELFARKLSKKQRLQAADALYFYYLDSENAEMSKFVLDQFALCAEPETLQLQQMLYRILIEKKSEDIDAIQEQMEKSTHKSKEEGMYAYLLGLQYLYKNETKQAQIYLNRAKNQLKGTPYAKKIKTLINERKDG